MNLYRANIKKSSYKDIKSTDFLTKFSEMDLVIKKCLIPCVVEKLGDCYHILNDGTGYVVEAKYLENIREIETTDNDLLKRAVKALELKNNKDYLKIEQTLFNNIRTIIEMYSYKNMCNGDHEEPKQLNQFLDYAEHEIIGWRKVRKK